MALIPEKIEVGSTRYSHLAFDGEDYYFPSQFVPSNSEKDGDSSTVSHIQQIPPQFLWKLSISAEHQNTLYFYNEHTNRSIWVLLQLDSTTGEEIKNEEAKMVAVGRIPKAKKISSSAAYTLPSVRPTETKPEKRMDDKDKSLSAKEKLELWRASRRKKNGNSDSLLQSPGTSLAVSQGAETGLDSKASRASSLVGQSDHENTKEMNLDKKRNSNYLNERGEEDGKEEISNSEIEIEPAVIIPSALLSSPQNSTANGVNLVNAHERECALAEQVERAVGGPKGKVERGWAQIPEDDRENTEDEEERTLFRIRENRRQQQILAQQRLKNEVEKKRKDAEERRAAINQQTDAFARSELDRNNDTVRKHDDRKPTGEAESQTITLKEKEENLWKEMREHQQYFEEEVKQFDELHDDLLAPEEDHFVVHYNSKTKTPNRTQQSASAHNLPAEMFYTPTMHYVGELARVPGSSTFFTEHPSYIEETRLNQIAIRDMNSTNLTRPPEVLLYKREGYGTFYYLKDPSASLIETDKNSFYDGEWKEDKKDGFGRLNFSENEYMEGTWEKDHLTGPAKLQTGRGLKAVLNVREGAVHPLLCHAPQEGNRSIRFIGEVAMDVKPPQPYERVPPINSRCRLGKGIYQLGNDDYVEWVPDKSNISASSMNTKQGTGKGRVRFSNGDVYIGSIVGFSLHGKGHYTFHSLASSESTERITYTGSFLKGKITGNGIFSFPNGNMYKGEVKDGLYEGQGTFMERGKFCYQGQWHQGQMHGIGRLLFDNGDVWEGEFVNNRRVRGEYRYRESFDPI